MHPHDSVKKRKDVLKEHEKEFKKFLGDEFEDPEHSDVLIEKKTKKERNDRPRA